MTAVAHAKKHAKKYTAAAVMAAIITALQMFGALAPLVCSLSFIHNTDACIKAGANAQKAAQDLGGLKLDEEAVDAEDGGL